MNNISKSAAIIIIVWLGMILPAYADDAHPVGIKLDGSIGSAGKLDLPGPDYDIKAEMGKQTGTNLFHSFDQFNLHKGESATFSGPDSVKNIISRVTGGNASWIDGKLGSTIPNADLYFLNPAGVMFGANASLDLGGSFHVSTADYLRLGENERFYTMPQADEILSLADPTAFGFLSDHPGGISAEGSFLSVPIEKTISVIGGDIHLHDSTWLASSGRVNLASAASAGEIQLNDTGIEMKGIEKQGEIAITRDADFRKYEEQIVLHDIETSGANGGSSVFIRAGQFELRGGAVTADTWGDSNGKGISIKVTDDVVLDGAGKDSGGRISSLTIGAGNACNIAVEAKRLTLDNRAAISSSSGGSGQGGNIAVSASDSVRISGDGTNKSGIYAQTVGTGSGGKILIDTPDLALDKSAQILAMTGGAGNAGEISLNVNRLTLTEKGAVSVSTAGTGHGGNINITAEDSVNISGSKSGITANAVQSGDGGNITLSASNLTVDDNGKISGDTFGDGDAGEIRLNVNKLILTEKGVISVSSYGSGQGGNISIGADKLSVSYGGISANSYGMESGAGNAGSIDIRAEQIELTEAVIGNSTFGAGNAENIDIQAGQIQLDKSLISSSASGAGSSGNIDIQAGQIQLTNDAAIDTGTFGAGQGGKIAIGADKFSVSDSSISANSYGTESGSGNSGGIDIQAEQLQLAGRSGIINATYTGNAGGIDIQAGQIQLTDSAMISSSTLGTGNGGTISIKVRDSFTASGSNGVSAGSYSTESGSGNAGNIDIRAGQMQLTNGALIGTGTKGSGYGGTVSIIVDESFAVSGYGTDEKGNFASGIFANTEGYGQGGKIFISARTVNLADTGTISGTSWGSGNAGEIVINAAESVHLTGNAYITTKAESAGGGKISVNAGEQIYLNSSNITGSVKQGYGNGGDIAADSKTIILNKGNVTANAEDGDGGAVFIRSENFLKSSDSRVEATSARGNQGTVEIQAPDIDISGSLTVMPGTFIDAAGMLPRSCKERTAEDVSRFVITGRDATPTPADDLQASPPEPFRASER